MATSDPSAPVFRQRLFVESLQARLAHCGQDGRCISLVNFGVDDFGTLLERVGQLAAQGTLGMIARVIADVGGDGAISARSGRGQFFVALPGTALAGAVEFAERARLRLANFQLDGSVSVGIVQTGPARLLDAVELIDAACGLAEQARRRGGGRIVATTA
jgi:GGDEF domain-containing protein